MNEKKIAARGEETIAFLRSSFRDPSGFMFSNNGCLYRQVNKKYREQYDAFIKSGLYNALTERGFLIPHKEVDTPVGDSTTAYKILFPEKIPFISYPYEWSFSQFKDAALLSLDIQCLALKYSMTMKDASAYNVQFQKGVPIFIDTLSFEPYQEGRPWVAYRQFCQHFLAPLALMSHRDIRLNQLLRSYIDGIPLDLASTLLPFFTWLRYGFFAHIHLHAKSQRVFSDTKNLEKGRSIKKEPKVSRLGLMGILDSLRKCLKKCDWTPIGTEWGDYYNDTNYSNLAFEYKSKTVKKYLAKVQPAQVWDLGANIGVFSRIASNMGIPTVAFDIDPAAVEINYRKVREEGEKNLLPLLLDLTNPSPGLGWADGERDSISQRGPVDCVAALALIHHLAISNNVPLEKIAAYFSEICRFLIIEFVPKTDSQVLRLLRSREDIFDLYNLYNFERVFQRYFKILEFESLKNSERTMFLMKNLSNI